MKNWNNFQELPMGFPLPREKTCGVCGTLHRELPTVGLICKRAALWFDCPCGSTLTLFKR